jgi:hypothetical protein
VPLVNGICPVLGGVGQAVGDTVGQVTGGLTSHSGTTSHTGLGLP